MNTQSSRMAVVGIPFGMLLLFAPTSGWSQAVLNQHVSTAGVQASESTYDDPVISDDDRWVAFSSTAPNLVAGDTSDFDIFVHDNVTGETVILAESMSDCRRPSISADGRFVVFQAPGTNAAEVWRHDRDADADGVYDEAGATATILISVDAAGGAANAASRSYPWAISDDGDRVVFESDATDLVAAADTNSDMDCFMRIVSTGTTARVSGAGNAGSYTPAISGNGLVVAFASNATNLLPLGVDTNSATDVYVRTVGVLSGGGVSFGAPLRVSVSTGGAQASGYSFAPAISDGGIAIAFESTAPDLVAGDTNAAPDVFVHNTVTGATTRVSVRSDGVQAIAGASRPAISGNGSVIAFQSSSQNLYGYAPNPSHVYARQLALGLTLRVSRAADGTPANGYSANGSLSEDGSHVAFTSDADNLLGAGGDTNTERDAFVREGTSLGAGSAPLAPGAGGVDDNPVTFSVDGPVDPNTEGIRDARGAPATPQIPLQPGNPIGYCIRMPAVPMATGVPTFRPGDVNSYFAFAVPSEAQMFQSAPPVPPPGGAPDGTNNQVLTAGAKGLVAGLGVPPPAWVSIPSSMPPAMPRDNIDAFSFGEDYFPEVMALGIDPTTAFLPDPPIDAMDLEIMPLATPWVGRGSLYSQPIVMDTSAPGISFRFSVDPWAIGLPATAVSVESGAFDIGAACLGWVSPGAAAGDIFGTPLMMRVGGVTVAGGGNELVHDNPMLALAAALPDTSEDDLDAVECVGENNVPWFAVAPMMPGNLHDRLVDVGPDLPAPGVASHDVANTAPLFFSVTRSSTGAPFSAVRSQFVLDGGAAADIFVTAKGMLAPPGVGNNLLFIDESEIGLYAADAPPVMGTSPFDQTDDLDAMILWVSPALRLLISTTIDELMMAMPWMPDPATESYFGPGMTVSIVSMLGDAIMPGDIRIGFSVTTDAIGLEYTAVDYQAGRVFPVGAPVAVAGDIFYAEPDGEPMNPNYLFFEEVDLGLDMGGWLNGISMDLADLSDNLDALDSIDEPFEMSGGGYEPPTDAPERLALRRLALEPNYPNPFNPQTTVVYSLPVAGAVQLSIHDVRGRKVATLVNGVREAGQHRVTWNGRDQAGRQMAAGIYFLRLEAAGEERTRKIVLVE